MEKVRVGVLMGGKSIEKEVSFNSGRTICDHLDTAHYHIVPLFQTTNGTLYILPWHFLHRGKISDFESRLAREAQAICWDDLKELIDFIYIAVHGRYAEDGTLQGILEVLEIPYLGSGVLASALGMDKIRQKLFLSSAGVSVPKGIAVPVEQIDNFDMFKDDIFNQLHHLNIQLPYVVKPSHEGSSLGIETVFNQDDLLPALRTASSINPYKRQAVLIEEKVVGMEFSCVIITDNKTGKLLPFPPTEVVPRPNTHIFDYEQKYMPGHAIEYTPARTSAENINRIHEACIKTMHVLEFTNLARIDGFLTVDGQVIIVDPNTLSGMAPASFLFREAAEYNMSHTQVINHLIETELKYYSLTDMQLNRQMENKDMLTKKMRVAVLLGGQSNEKEISLESGRNICYKLSPQKYDVIPVFVDSMMRLHIINQRLLVRSSTQEIESLLEPSMALKWHDLARIADFVFIGLHGGKGENGAVQGTLEMLGLPYNGSGVFTSALCMDKYKTNQFLKQQGFIIPESLLISKQEWTEDPEGLREKIYATLSTPLIIKPHDDGCSVMVQKVKNKHDIDAALETIFASGKEYALVEECIVGMELTVGVIGNSHPRALPPSRAVAAADVLSIKEKFLPGAGENQTPAPLEHDALVFVQKTVEGVYKAVNCKGYARIDCFYQDEHHSPTGIPRVVIIEINTLPGMTPATCIFHQAAEIQMKPMDFIDHIVQLGFEEHSNAVSTTEKSMELSEAL